MRFFVTHVEPDAKLIRLYEPDAAHIFKVLRMRPGEAITICDLDGMMYDCVLDTVTRECVTAKVAGCRHYSNEPTADVTVYASLSKGERFDFLVQKCVECGARHIVPVESDNCVVRIEPGEREKKRVRYERIAIEASKQSHRSRAVTVGEIVPFAVALEQSRDRQFRILLHEKEGQLGINAAIGCAEKTAAFAVYTGPEGGFSPREAALAEEKGVRTVSLGPRILRCETAPVAALCSIMYHTGNFDIGV